ncbi:MAG: hypothetical protein K2M76_04145 [Muribaculaceae bacterium]|nr:hypothetical protein [Muribaculaceae bacterium]
MSTVRLQVNDEAVMKRVWALAAIRALDDDGSGERVPMVGRGETAMLAVVVRDAAVLLAGSMGRYLTWMDADAEDGVMLEVAVTGHESNAWLERLRRVAEGAVALRVMGMLLCGRDAAAEKKYDDERARMESQLRAMLDGMEDCQIKRVWL